MPERVRLMKKSRATREKKHKHALCNALAATSHTMVLHNDTMRYAVCTIGPSILIMPNTSILAALTGRNDTDEQDQAKC